MRRTLFLLVAWTTSFLALYLSLVGLELDWNLFDWLPRHDAKAIALMIIALAALTALWCLAIRSTPGFSRMFSFVGCLVLFFLGVYVLPAEPEGKGFFSRRSPSPLWYRGGRL